MQQSFFLCYYLFRVWDMTVGESQKTQLKEVTTGHRADLLCVDNMTYISYFNDNSLRWHLDAVVKRLYLLPSGLITLAHFLC